VGGLLHQGGANAGDLLSPGRRTPADRRCDLLETDGVVGDEPVVEQAIALQDMEESEGEGGVASRERLQVKIGLLRRWSAESIDATAVEKLDSTGNARRSETQRRLPGAPALEECDSPSGSIVFADQQDERALVIRARCWYHHAHHPHPTTSITKTAMRITEIHVAAVGPVRENRRSIFRDHDVRARFQPSRRLWTAPRITMR
jgi:hypothetical protein